MIALWVLALFYVAQIKSQTLYIETFGVPIILNIIVQKPKEFYSPNSTATQVAIRECQRGSEEDRRCFHYCLLKRFNLLNDYDTLELDNFSPMVTDVVESCFGIYEPLENCVMSKHIVECVRNEALKRTEAIRKDCRATEPRKCWKRCLFIRLGVFNENNELESIYQQYMERHFRDVDIRIRNCYIQNRQLDVCDRGRKRIECLQL